MLRLVKIVRSGNSEARLVQRAQIILACAQELENQTVAKQLSLSVLTVSKWRKRFADHSFSGISDAIRSGKPAEGDSAKASFRKFVGLSISSPLPDHSTIWRFRALLQQGDLWLELLNSINDGLEKRDYKIKFGEISIVDATVIEAQRCRKHQDAEGNDTRDAEASASVKQSAAGNNTTTYGFKAHVNADEDGFIKKFTYTTGRLHDSQEFEKLLTHNEQAVYADRAYDSKERRQLLCRLGIDNKIQRRAARQRPLTPEQKAANKQYGMIRSRVERVFAQLKLHHGVAKARYLGIARNRVRFALCSICHNLKCARGIMYEMQKYDKQPQAAYI